MNNHPYPPEHDASGKAARAEVRLGDRMTAGSWMTFLILLFTGNVGIVNRWRLRSCELELTNRKRFLARTSTKLTISVGFLVMGLSLQEHSLLVLSLLVALVPLFLAATWALIREGARLTTIGLSSTHMSPRWVPWAPLCESAASLTLPFPLRPPCATA